MTISHQNWLTRRADKDPEVYPDTRKRCAFTALHFWLFASDTVDSVNMAIFSSGWTANKY